MQIEFIWKNRQKNLIKGPYAKETFYLDKVGCIFSMVIWSEFRVGQYRDDDHLEDAPQFNIKFWTI